MAIYNVLSTNITEILKEWIQNDDLVKLLVDQSKTPFNFDLNSFDRFLLFDDEYIIKKPKLTFPETEQKSYISIYLDRSEMSGKSNVYNYDMNLCIDIVCHIDNWDIEDSEGLSNTRPYMICDIIDNLVRNTKVKSIRGNLVIERPARLFIPNDRFMGYKIHCSLTNPSEMCG